MSTLFIAHTKSRAVVVFFFFFFLVVLAQVATKRVACVNFDTRSLKARDNKLIHRSSSRCD